MIGATSFANVGTLAAGPGAVWTPLPVATVTAIAAKTGRTRFITPPAFARLRRASAWQASEPSFPRRLPNRRSVAHSRGRRARRGHRGYRRDVQAAGGRRL